MLSSQEQVERYQLGYVGSVKRRKEGSTRGLLLQASFGGRSRKAARGSHTFGPPEHHWTLGKGPTSLGYYQRREELRGNKPKNRCPLKVKKCMPRPQ